MLLPKNFDLPNLKQRRKSNGYPKQSDVAEYLGVSRQTVHSLEAHGIVPQRGAKFWVKLQSVYGLTIEQWAEVEESYDQSREKVVKPPAD